MKKFDKIKTEELMTYIVDGTDDRIFAIAELIRRNIDIGMIFNSTKIDMLFLQKIENIIKNADEIGGHTADIIKEGAEIGLKCKSLATLVKDINFDFTINDIEKKAYNKDDLKELKI